MSPETMTPAPEMGDNSALIPPECLPDLDQFQIEDGKPVDSVFNEKQMRLLTRPLYLSWQAPDGKPFQVFADVGLFYAVGHPPLSPDVMLSLNMAPGGNLSEKENRSYFVWLRKKPPDVVIEVVSDKRGGEASYKKDEYARAGVPYYVVFDPEGYLDGGELRCWGLIVGEFQPLGEPFRFKTLGLGLTIWQGTYEGYPARWLRWCDDKGHVIPLEEETIAEARQRADEAERRADDERAKREKLEARLRELGHEP